MHDTETRSHIHRYLRIEGCIILYLVAVWLCRTIVRRSDHDKMVARKSGKQWMVIHSKHVTPTTFREIYLT